MKITVAQLNYHVGNFEKNKNLITDAINRAKDDGSDLIIFSELCISGYPPLDLLDRPEFIEKCHITINEIAAECKGITAIVGSPTFNNNSEGKKLYNSALALSGGRIIFTANKALLPTYDIFDEYRHFEPEKKFTIFSFSGLRLAVTICEDLWDERPLEDESEKSRLYTISPMDELAGQSPDMIINISASPFSYKGVGLRNNIFSNKALKHNIPLICVNQTGAFTEIIFDGASMVINRKGKIIDQLPSFEECIRTYSTDEIFDSTETGRPDERDMVELIYRALITGIRDYFSKMNFRKCLLGLSGGIDSAVCLCLAVAALGRDAVKVLMLPSRYSSEHSVSDAVALAKRLDVSYEVVSIEEPFKAFEEVLEPLFRGLPKDVTEENIQARVRAVILMAVCNKEGRILLNTSNKSEAAVGYGTLYGDMAGGLSVIGDVYKTDVYRLAEFINRNGELIPQNTISKPPSAELKPDQFDTDSLPAYPMLDPILYQYIDLQKPAGKIISSGFDRDTVMKVIRMINNNEYKRYQAPPILRISSKAFGAGRRMPLVARY